ncbi:signal transduction histidine kinase [Streptosporangium becharense]|uniref:histidine kinase n=1 Tax=Streptosporangium becharense TaxID=1816182 RepID=A0A7W9IE27_9ACTN|nr:sensor histidine kinase [Streptosporangium becharense]MBB2909997.1 signal transduction histidine kinase [Streptosporangium becharense]MBB5819048.1 signal transduction histidine kinase [Streptosporangium becharense]
MFGRVRAWSRRHPEIVEALWLAPFILLSLFNAWAMGTGNPGTGVPQLGVVGFLALSCVLTVPLFWMRRHPIPVFVFVSLACFVQWLLGVQPLFFNVSVLIAMYGVAARCATRWAVSAGLVVELGLLLAFGRIETDLGLRNFVSSSVFVVAIWITGIYARTRRRYLEGLEERAERAEHERDQQARLSAAAERARIARELHDVVAHNVSVMIVQADGAAYAIDHSPEQAREAMRAVSVTGRRALAEMRRLVGVLRTGDAPQEYAPQPGLSQLDHLVAQVRGSGLPVDFRVTGAPQELPEGEQLTVYRIVQEALTNTLKHGGPESSATVEMEYGVREVLLRVTDDGRGAAAPAREGGHGLIGMRERAAMFGGSVEAGPLAGGGFRVVARLPIGGVGTGRAA